MTSERLEIPTIPPEIIAQFIASLQHDIPAILACTLVCKDWVQTARQALTSEEDYLMVNLHEPQSLRPWVDVLAPSTSTLRECVNSVVLRCFLQDPLESLSPADLSLMQDALACIARLPCVTSLRLWKAGPTGIPLLFPEGVPFTALMPGLKAMHIQHSFFDTFGEMTKLIGAAQGLESLEVMHAQCSDDTAAAEQEEDVEKAEVPTSFPGRPPTLPHLRRLELHLVQRFGEILSWLMSIQPPPPISTLALHGIGFPLATQDLSKLESFLAQLGDGLHHLYLEHTAISGPSTSSFNLPDLHDKPRALLANTVRLRSNTRLRSITLECQPHSDLNAYARSIPNLLNKVRSRDISKIDFKVFPRRGRGDSQDITTKNVHARLDVSDTPWAAIDQVLQSVRFVTLESVVAKVWVYRSLTRGIFSDLDSEAESEGSEGSEDSEGSEGSEGGEDSEDPEVALQQAICTGVQERLAETHRRGILQVICRFACQSHFVR